MNFSSVIDPIFERPLYPERMKLLKRALYMLVLVKCVYWTASFTLYFGEPPLSVFEPHAASVLREIPFLLYDSHTPWTAAVALAVVAALCILRLFVRAGQIAADFLIWLLVLNIHYKVYATLTGGDYLLNQLLLFNILLGTTQDLAGRPFRIFLHNAGYVSVVIQICLVYLVSATAKLLDAEWREGTALMLTAGVEHYRNFPLQTWMRPGIWLVLNYVVLSYQFLFPALIWFRPLKKWLLAIGVIMHLYIAFGMGLLLFGITMIAAYIPFWPVNEPNEPSLRGLRAE